MQAVNQAVGQALSWAAVRTAAAAALVGVLAGPVVAQEHVQPGAVPAPGIAQVLQASQLQRLAQRPAADEASPAAQRVRTSFERLLAMRAQDGAATLRLVGGELYAEALFGQRCVAVSESVGDLPEGERLLLLAHELGHLAMGHWSALSGLYRQFIPGEVRPDTTGPVAAALGAQAHVLSHRQEFEADAFGYTLVRQLGFGVDTAFGLLTRHGVQLDGATHPGTRRRLAQLRLLDGQLNHDTLRGGEAASVAVAPPPAPLPTGQ